MVLDLVAVAARDLALDLLDPLVEELDDLTGVEAHHMVVMVAVRQLEYRGAPFEVVTGHEARALELREHAIHGREAQLLTGVEQQAVDRLRRQVAFLALLQDLQDLEARRSHLQSGFTKILPPFHCLLPCVKWGMIRGSIMAHTRRALHLSSRALPRVGAAWRAPVAVLCAALVAVAASGCAFRMSVQQGNVVDVADLEQVREGMTRSQVQFLLGTPLISDPFHADRWDYTYFFRQGRRRDVTRYWVTVFFEDDRVVRIETRVPPRGMVVDPAEELDPREVMEATEVAASDD